MEIINKTFEEYWGYYWRVTSRHRIPEIFKWDQNLVDLIEKECELETGNSILDLGCGGGDQAKLFAKKGYRITGIDKVPSLVEYAIDAFKHNSLDGEFLIADMRNIDYHEQFNLCVILSGTFGLLKEEENEQLLHNIHRALKPDGQVVLSYLPLEQCSRVPLSRNWYPVEGGFSLREEWFAVPTSTYRTRNTLILDEGKIIREPERADYNSNEVIRCYGCKEIENLVKRNGYEVTAHLSNKQINNPNYIPEINEPRGLIFLKKVS